MADLSQTIPSQPRFTDSKPLSDVLNKSLSPKPKPPLLPKPQFPVNNGKFSPVKKIQNSSQTIISVKNVVVDGHEETVREKAIILNCDSQDKLREKPPALHPKPVLPPKSNAFRISRAKLDLKSPENVCGAPVRPPRSPKRLLKDNPLEEFQSKLLLFESSSCYSFNEQGKKSASLPRSEFVNGSPFREFAKSPDSAPTPRPRLKNKPRLELDLASNVPIYATVDYSKKKKNRQPNDSGVLRSSDSFINYYRMDASSTNHVVNTEIVENSECETNNRDNSQSMDVHCEIIANNNNCTLFNNNYDSITCDEPDCEETNIERDVSDGSVPQSFLYRIVGSSSKCEEDTGERPEGQVEDRAAENKSSSFLHKYNSNVSAESGPEEEVKSFIVVTKEDVSATEEPSHNSVERSKSDLGLLVPPPLMEDSSPRSGNEESGSVGKKFPWFGSFGKGNKKRSGKKERCSSQFYASPITLQGDANMNDCSRTKSLPNIKSNDKAGDPDELSVNSDWNDRISEGTSNDYGSLTHASDVEDDKDSLIDGEVQDQSKQGNKAFLIAKELMTSEEVFINVLKLLNQDFRTFVEQRNKDKNVIPQSNLNKILNHLPELQTLNEVLLTDLKKRIENWETNPKIADVIVKKGAFLKLYTSYIQNFESQTKYLDDCVAKYPKFGKVLKEFESLDICRMLSLKHYMLKPVQRIPQYRLLLSDYLKHIDESSPDYEDTESALKIVSEVADHVNRNLKYGDKNGTLMHFQSLLSDYELIRPGRELIKDGPLEKICRKSVKDRYFILLNDCLLHTTYWKNSLKIHQELPLSGMKVYYNDDQKHRCSFTVQSITRSFVLCAKSENERRDWVKNLQSAIEEYISRQKTFLNVKLPETDAFKLGKEAPVWIQDNKVTMCQICTAEFTSLFRRHHCRACGKVVCKNCGGSQAPLQYDSFKTHRVCDQCFPILLKDYEESEDEIYELLKLQYPGPNQDIQNIYLNNKAKFVKYTSTTKPKFIPHRLKEVSANDAESEMNGLLYRKSEGRKTWKLYWYVLKEHVLYVYRASEDVKALETIPVLGYEVKKSEVNYENVDKHLLFILEHRHQPPIVFHAATEESAERWYKALKRASEFEELTGS